MKPRTVARAPPATLLTWIGNQMVAQSAVFNQCVLSCRLSFRQAVQAASSASHGWCLRGCCRLSRVRLGTTDLWFTQADGTSRGEG
jgi:hypothetical protein